MNTRNYEPPKWRIRELIDGLKPYRRIVERLEARGYPRLPQSSIAGWRMHNSIPNVWLPAFIDLGLESRVIVSIDDFREPESIALEPFPELADAG
jgi:hypothetical protein